MASFNQVILLGNLTRDPQMRYTPSQMAVCDFGVACNRKFKAADGSDREEVTFVDCTAWSKQAELINTYFTKGKPIFIQGRLKLDQWEDKQGGGKRSKLSVVVENFQFIGGRDGQGGGQGGGGGQNYGDEGGGRPMARSPQRAPAAARPQSQQQAPPPDDDGPPIGDSQEFKGDDIPF
jgi:single-strand DNA-binding protein